MPKLVAKDGPNRGMSYDIGANECTLGRDQGNTIQLPYQLVSRRHARLVREGDTWYAEDLNSRNGTFVNDEKADRTALALGDEVRVGEVLFTFVDEPSASEWVGEETEEGPAITQTISAAALAERRDDIEGLVGEPTDAADRRLRALLALARAAAQARSLPELFEPAAKALADALDADRAVPVLYDADKSALAPWNVARSALDKRLKATPISSSVVEYVREKRAAVLSEHAASDSRFRDSPSIQTQRIQTALCAPMTLGDRLLGMLYVDRLGDAENFSKSDLEFLGVAASQVAVSLENIRTREAMSEDKLTLLSQLKGQFNIVGESAPVKAIYEFISRAAPTDAGVLIVGESGTGKELVARAIHYNSARSAKAFEAVNCAALTSTLIESELFGHVKGAFTGAVDDKPGRFELAHDGTIFLDEISELPDTSQSKLLRVLEESSLRRVGDVRDHEIDVRVIAATNKVPEALIAEGKFREDLFYRLNVLRVELPLLRDRDEDVELLARHFLGEFTQKCSKHFDGFSKEALAALRRYDWPGNVRELRNAVERMVVMCDGQTLELDDIPLEFRGGRVATRTDDNVICPLEEIERQHIVRVLAHLGGNKKKTAETLGIDRSTLYAKLKAYGIE